MMINENSDQDEEFSNNDEDEQNQNQESSEQSPDTSEMDMSDDEEIIQSDMIEIGDEEDIDNEELTKAVRSQVNRRE